MKRTRTKRSKPVVTIDRINLTKERLAKLPPRERQLLLLLGHIQNEINVLVKLIILSRPGKPHIRVISSLSPTYEPNRPTAQMIGHAQSGQTLILIRILIGKLHEAWELFTNRFLSDRELSGKYLQHLDQEATAALEKLKKHFGRQSPLTQIRNKFSFHYKDEDHLIEASFQQLPADVPWNVYFGKIVGNSFHYASELVVTSGVLGLVGQLGNDDHTRFSRLSRLTIQVGLQMIAVFADVSGSILGSTGPPPKPTRIRLRVQRAKVRQIPYFFITSRRRKVPGRD